MSQAACELIVVTPEIACQPQAPLLGALSLPNWVRGEAVIIVQLSRVDSCISPNRMNVTLCGGAVSAYALKGEDQVVPRFKSWHRLVGCTTVSLERNSRSPTYGNIAIG